MLKHVLYLDIYLYWVSFNFLCFSAVGVCVLPDFHSKDESHVSFSPDNINHKIIHECQELSSRVSSTSSSLEENKIVLEEQSTEEEVDLMEKIKGNTVSTRSVLLY